MRARFVIFWFSVGRFLMSLALAAQQTSEQHHKQHSTTPHDRCLFVRGVLHEPMSVLQRRQRLVSSGRRR
jgi:hypothetical protein